MDIELIRDILLQLHAGGREFAITGYAEEEVHRAAEELRRQGYILAATAWIPGEPYEYVMPRRLTEKGEHLAQAIESDFVWAHVKQWLPRREDREELEKVQRTADKINRIRN